VTVRLHIDEEAEADVVEAAAYYRRISPALSAAFRTQLRSVLDLLRQRPRSGAPYLHDTRRSHFARFPYSVIYVLDDDDVSVVAVVHDRRDPEHLRTRVGL
jgi:toxin ParE1/3/4